MPVAGDAEGFNIETEDLRGVWLWRTTGPFLVQVISHVDMPTRLGDQLDRALLLLDTQAERLAPRLDATQP
jgi:hypothetical protein